MKKSAYIYLYDGSFVSLLNLITELLHERTIPLNIKDDTFQGNLFEETINLKIKNDETIISKIIEALGLKIFNTLYYLFLSTQENKEMLIFYFLLYSLKAHHKVFYLRNIAVIDKALKACQYVSRENHKLKGFLRFQELENHLLYAEMAPENNILPLLVKHFQQRLAQENWVIVDTKRKIMALYNQKKVMIIAAPKINLPKLSAKEASIEVLWQTFYQTIAITERRNERCRQNFMPKKYWPYIIEMKEEYETSSTK